MAQEDYFLKIEGVKGESQDDKHKDEIHVSFVQLRRHQRRHRRLEPWLRRRSLQHPGHALHQGGRCGLAQSVHRLLDRQALSQRRLSRCAAPARSRRNISIYKLTEVLRLLRHDQRPRGRRHRAGERVAQLLQGRNELYAPERRRHAGREEHQDLRRQGQQGVVTPCARRRAPCASRRARRRRRPFDLFELMAHRGDGDGYQEKRPPLGSRDVRVPHGA